MIDAVYAIPPAFVVWLAALLALFAGRRAGIVAGITAYVLALAWTLTAPTGTHGSWTFLEFVIVPVAIDPAARVTGLAFTAFGTVAIGYLAVTGGDRRHVVAALGYAGAAIWAVFAGDWLGLLVGWELMALASTILVWLHGGDAVRVGFRYALVHAIGGAILAAGLALHVVAQGGGTDALHYGDGVSSGLPALAVGIGVGINAAIIGVHVWLPDTYASPHVGVSVVLSAYTTKLAVYAAYRAFPEGNLVLAYVGGVMAIVGAGYALAQKDARRLLAYHIQAQVGYILAGIGIGSSLGIAGAFAHLFNNVLFKGLLFMVAGLIVLRAGTGRLQNGGRLGLHAPVATGIFLVAAASITAVPGTNGFVSKGMVLDAALEGGHAPLRWLLLVGAVGTIVSFWKFGYYAIRRGEETRLRDATAGQALTMLPVAVACIAIGLAYGLLFDLLPAAAEWSTEPYSQRHVLEKVALFGAGTIVFLAGRPLFERFDGGTDIDAIRDPLVFSALERAATATEAVFGTLAAAERVTRRRTIETVSAPDEAIARTLPDDIGEQYRERASGVAGSLGVAPNVWYRYLALICCLVVALTVGVVVE
ncbi:multisubunit sodium/proton antiporter, MrpD subunit [Natronorubrum sediminis]|uniref:Multisubunit sodium/proton antiporter, MrpD subunit n=1 Tax=Natronorubrum sediminis TaxID=640943 RepID=A0A1H6FPL9_9EURY|nr:proton-conducting transporter membrane subunit [Natronorubrum sediminis]SEH11803.1 multisubunit sodium/proton antiporter, MrpD subunit [Natronorubrum sediminis]